MIKLVHKYWIPFSVVILLATLASLLLWPAITQPMAWIIVIIGAGVAVIESINHHYLKYINLHHSRGKLVRNAAIDVLGILITIILCIWMAVTITAQLTPPLANAIEKAIPGTGFLTGVIAGLVFALGIGFVVGFFIRWIWGRVMAKLERQFFKY